jgi:hypothetical protein
VSEHDDQAALYQWAGLQIRKYPELGLMFAIPNGGDRHIAVARKLQAEGVKRGVPDNFLPVPRGSYHGLWIEMKYGKNKATAEQMAWHEALRGKGYQVEVCYGWERAAEIIVKYLGEE